MTNLQYMKILKFKSQPDCRWLVNLAQSTPTSLSSVAHPPLAWRFRSVLSFTPATTHHSSSSTTSSTTQSAKEPWMNRSPRLLWGSPFQSTKQVPVAAPLWLVFLVSSSSSSVTVENDAHFLWTHFFSLCILTVLINTFSDHQHRRHRDLCWFLQRPDS